MTGLSGPQPQRRNLGRAGGGRRGRLALPRPTCLPRENETGGPEGPPVRRGGAGLAAALATPLRRRLLGGGRLAPTPLLGRSRLLRRRLTPTPLLGRSRLLRRRLTPTPLLGRSLLGRSRLLRRRLTPTPLLGRSRLLRRRLTPTPLLGRSLLGRSRLLRRRLTPTPLLGRSLLGRSRLLRRRLTPTPLGRGLLRSCCLPTTGGLPCRRLLGGRFATPLRRLTGRRPLGRTLACGASLCRRHGHLPSIDCVLCCSNPIDADRIRLRCSPSS